jgi:multicomponent Na+:H+ antiporter subunit F
VSWAAGVAFALLGAGALLALVRLVRGPSLLDRVVASDAMLVITAGGLGVHVAVSRDPSAVPVLVVVSLLGYIGAIAVVRYVGGMVLGRPPDDEAAAGEERR